MAARTAQCAIDNAVKHYQSVLHDESERALQTIDNAQNQLSRAIGQLHTPNVNNEIKNIRSNLEAQARLATDSQIAQLRENLKRSVVSAVMAAFPALNAAHLAALAAAIGQASADILVVKAQINEVIRSANLPAEQFVPWVRNRAPRVLDIMQSNVNDAFHNFVTSPISDFLNVSDIVKPTQDIFNAVIQDIREGVNQFNSAASLGNQAVNSMKADWVNKLQSEIQQKFSKAADDMVQGMLAKAALGI